MQETKQGISVVRVRYKRSKRTGNFDPCKLVLKKGDEVILQTQNGLEFGVCLDAPQTVEAESLDLPLEKVHHIANPNEKKKMAELRTLETEDIRQCKLMVAERELPMKIIAGERNFENSRLSFYFTADGRVDFRELVRALGSHFRMRIDLRQVGVRDETKLLDGIGFCGRPFCCAGFLNGFHSVSIKMAKEQGLSLAPQKISGTCGRLMCCLQYEQASYEQLSRKAPRPGTPIETPSGKGTIVEVALLSDTVRVRFPEGISPQIQSFSLDDCAIAERSRTTLPTGESALFTRLPANEQKPPHKETPPHPPAPTKRNARPQDRPPARFGNKPQRTFQSVDDFQTNQKEFRPGSGKPDHPKPPKPAAKPNGKTWNKSKKFGKRPPKDPPKFDADE